MKEEEIGRMQEFMSKMLAFGLYLERGMSAVESSFPEYKAFVEARKGMSLREVKDELSPAAYGLAHR